MGLFCSTYQNSTIRFISYVCMMLQIADSLSEFICGLCKVITSNNIMPKLGTPNGGTYELTALDIASDYHSYVFKIKECQQKV